jgi:hypothetical protein
MTAIKQEILDYIEIIPDSKLEALKPILSILADDTIILETDLTDEERAIIARGREEYESNPDSFVSLESILRFSAPRPGRAFRR